MQVMDINTEDHRPCYLSGAGADADVYVRRVPTKQGRHPGFTVMRCLSATAADLDRTHDEVDRTVRSAALAEGRRCRPGARQPLSGNTV
jgi:hypothetical protein